MSQHDIRTLLRHPAAAISTDGWTLDARPDGMRVEGVTVHPRQFGTYPKVLGSYVRDEKILTLPDAVRKMTSLPAGFLGLNDRGALREGAWADIVVFDLDKVDCTADYSNPASYPTGIRHVLVNGQPAVQEGQRTEARSGKVLRRG
jgi:N-acyl-D-amino-acid deacylase